MGACLLSTISVVIRKTTNTISVNLRLPVVMMTLLLLPRRPFLCVVTVATRLIRPGSCARPDLIKSSRLKLIKWKSNYMDQEFC